MTITKNTSVCMCIAMPLCSVAVRVSRMMCVHGVTLAAIACAVCAAASSHRCVREGAHLSRYISMCARGALGHMESGGGRTMLRGWCHTLSACMPPPMRAPPRTLAHTPSLRRVCSAWLSDSCVVVPHTACTWAHMMSAVPAAHVSRCRAHAVRCSRSGRHIVAQMGDQRVGAPRTICGGQPSPPVFVGMRGVAGGAS